MASGNSTRSGRSSTPRIGHLPIGLAPSPSFLSAAAISPLLPMLHGIVYDVRSGRLHSVVEAVDGVERAEALLPHA